MLTYRALRDIARYKEAILSDFSTSAFGDAFRGLGLVRVSVWLQHDPPASVTRWEGTDIDTLSARSAASKNPVIAKWRGLMRVFSDPSEVERYWDASRRCLFSWTAEKEGRESEITVFRNPHDVEAYLEAATHFQNDPELLKILDRVRRRQGFTRIETWHQASQDQSLILVLMEADDLKAALVRTCEEEEELVGRILKPERSMIVDPALAPPAAKLLAQWHT